MTGQVVEEKKVEKKEEIKIENIDPKVEDILTKYYKEKGKEAHLERFLKILFEQGIAFVSDWKNLSQEQKRTYPHALANDLDKIAGIKKDVSKNIKIQTGNGDRIRQHNTNEPRGSTNSKIRRSSISKNVGSSTIAQRGEQTGQKGELLHMQPIMHNIMDNPFDLLLIRLYSWFGFDDSILREQVPDNIQYFPDKIDLSEGNKGLYQRLDDHEVTLRKRVKSKGCK